MNYSNPGNFLLKSEKIVKLAKLSSSSWGWPAYIWEDDFKQESILVMLENPDFSPIEIANTTAKRLLSHNGWHRIKIGNEKKWVDDATAYKNSSNSYLRNSERKRKARMKLSPEKRKEIARKGALARAQKVKENKQNVGKLCEK